MVTIKGPGTGGCACVLGAIQLVVTRFERARYAGALFAIVINGASSAVVACGPSDLIGMTTLALAVTLVGCALIPIIGAACLGLGGDVIGDTDPFAITGV
jgi:hypothetical protein